ncbi:MAG: AfsR/SARP family transcriptional regulator [Actinobacteria bacterium]|nr:MAG: AfsR/SARP family transcriptional regulator [Actinomycetota bacterium]
MEFRVLGTVEVAGADGPRPLHGRKELAVLAYLLANAGRSVPADELVWAVWGEDAPPSAHKSLQVRLSRLRADLGGGAARIARDGAGYRLAVEPGELDAQRFERLVGEAAALAPAEAAEAYGRALALVRGRPYADVADLDALQSEIRRLEELRLAAVEGRLRALVELGRHGDALPELDRAVDAEPLHEGLAALQLLALYRAGRQADALAAYRALVRRLDDVGLEPSAELRELERRVLVQDPRRAPRRPPTSVSG